MTWHRVDDDALDHPKFARAIRIAGADAWLMWSALVAFASKRLTDGFVDEDLALDVFGPVRGPRSEEARSAALGALVTSGLLEVVEGGYQIHDYLEWGRSRADTEAVTRSETDRKRAYRARKTQECPAPVPPVSRTCPAGTTPSVPAVSRECPATVPDVDLDLDPDQEILLGGSSQDLSGSARVGQPTESAPPPERGELVRPARSVKADAHVAAFERAWATEAPDQLEFTSAHRELAAQVGVADVAAEWLACRDHYRAQGHRTAHWEAQFASWLRKAQRFAPRRARSARDEAIERETAEALARDRRRRLEVVADTSWLDGPVAAGGAS
jgi:hypothetical protein